MLKTGKVYVYKIPKGSATKISEIINGKTQKRLNQTKISGNIKETFMVGQSASTGKLATGLDKEVDNTLKGESINHPDFQFLQFQDKVLLQHIIEYKYNLAKNSLHAMPANVNDKRHLENPSYYQTFRWKLNDGLTILDLNKLDDLLTYYAMLESKRFANTRKEYDSGKFPYADYYLAEQDETDNEKFTKKQLRDTVKAHLNMGKVADSEMQKKFVKILLPSISKGKLSNIQAYNSLSEAADTNERYKDGEEFISKFNKLINMLNDAPGKARFNALVVLQEGLNSYVLSEKAGTYNWIAKDLTIGASKEKAIDWILDPNKGELLDELLEQIKHRNDIYELV